MYEDFFGFVRKPFSSIPKTDEYFPGATIETARETLVRCIQRGEGAGLVIGPSGTGKTLLCRMLAEHFRDVFAVALLHCGRLSTRRALFQAILYELGQPYRGMDEGELRLALVEHLTTSEDCPDGIVLLVDEAHTLPLRLLEEIRMLTNLVGNGQPRVRLVLAGGSMLEERLAIPKLDSFSQRIVARCYLESLSRTETRDYIHAQINRASGLEPESAEAEDDADGTTAPEEPQCRIFTVTACPSVYQATDGVPRLINQLCDHGLVLAYVSRREEVDAMLIEEAWGDLQQLPTPWNGEPADEGAVGNVIEFGGLDDQPSDADDTGTAGSPPSEEITAEQLAADEYSLPQLRISPDTGQPGDGIVEPSQQLGQIEEMVAEAAEDFCPAGSIGPEVELVFDEPSRPFREEFEEEEVVTDRHALPVEHPQEPPVPATDESETAPAEPDQVEVTADRGPIAGPQEPEESFSVDSLEDSVSAVPETEEETFLLLSDDADVAAEADEVDLSIGEDDYGETREPCRAAATEPRRFGRLFATLRRN